jgi:uncharacterized protein (TIGR02246 family)
MFPAVLALATTRPALETLMTLTRRCAIAATILLGACRSAIPAAGPAPESPGDAAAIRGVLEESTREWNRGNLEGFVLPYDSLSTFVTANGVIRGKAAIRERYATSYFRTGTPTGVLAFRDLEVRMLGRDHALVVGRYVVSGRGGGQEATGLFSLTMIRRPEGWRIIHDHSS